MRRNYYRHRGVPGLALAAFAAATIAGCTMAPTAVDDAPTAAVDAVDEAPADELPNQPEGTFGKGAVKYDDGVTIKLGTPETFDPSESAYTEGNSPYYVKFTVSVENGSNERIDPVLMYVSLASGETEGVAVYDVVNGLSSPPETAISPGDARSWVVAFGVTDPDDLTAQVAMNDLVHDDALFTLR